MKKIKYDTIEDLLQIYESYDIYYMEDNQLILAEDSDQLLDALEYITDDFYI